MFQLEDFIPIEVLEAPLPDDLAAVDSTIVFIDATLAQQLLERNIEPEPGKAGTNRKSSPFEIKNLAAAMLEDRWHFNHQGIAFDSDGFMRDGANRLKAVVLAAKTRPDIAVPMKVTINLPLDAVRTMDLVRRRTLGDQLNMEGHVNTLALGSTARLCYLFDTAQFDTPHRPHWTQRPNRSAVEDFVAANPDLPEAVRRASGSKLFNVSAVAAAIFVAGRLRPELNLDLFLEQLFEGENLHKGDPVFALRRWAINHGRKMPPPYEQLAVILKSMRDFRKGTEVQVAVWKATSEPFPRP